MKRELVRQLELRVHTSIVDHGLTSDYIPAASARVRQVLRPI